MASLLANPVVLLLAVLAYHKLEQGGDVLQPLLLLGGILAVLLGNILLNQNKMLYSPVCQTHADYPVSADRRDLNSNHPDFRAPPADMRYVDLYVQCNSADDDDAKIHAWLFPGSSTTPRTVIIYSHGNAGNIGHRIQTWQLYRANLPANVDLLCYDYRGYGNSTGQPSEPGLVADCLACVRHCHQQQQQKYDRIVLLGTSLGAAVAVRAWHEAGPGVVHSLVLENGFTSVCDVACDLMPLVAPFRALLASERGSQLFLTNVFDTLKLLRRQQAGSLCPVLVLCGEEDDIVPPVHSVQLYEAAAATSTKTATFRSFPQAGHNNLPDVGGAAYFTILNQFLANPYKIDDK